MSGRAWLFTLVLAAMLWLVLGLAAYGAASLVHSYYDPNVTDLDTSVMGSVSDD